MSDLAGPHREPRDVVAIVRDADKAADLAARGVEVRVAEYADADALGKALVGLDKVLLISSSEVGRRFAQHRNVIDAAASAGVPYLACTSMTKATESSSPLAPEHRQTEEYLAASGLAHTVLRNNWYHENYLAQLPAITESGVLTAAAGEGKVAAAARRDFADGAATVLTTDGHERKVYEFTGDTALSYADIADTFGQVIGRAVAYRPVAAADLVAAMVQAGVDEGTAAFVAAIDTSIAEGRSISSTRPWAPSSAGPPHRWSRSSERSDVTIGGHHTLGPARVGPGEPRGLASGEQPQARHGTDPTGRLERQRMDPSGRGRRTACRAVCKAWISR